MAATAIKDTIHGYIELDSFERRVVDSPWFQRLRRVRQNDVASYVYPTMSTSRFEHSLGAMHLAGECLDAALQDRATQHNVKRFLGRLQDELESAADVRIASDKLALFARRCARMYGALHDIGHPPYSHLIEACYQPAAIGIKGAAAHWHEWNGAEIVEKHLPASVTPSSEDADVLRTTAHLCAKGRMTPALKALKGLVDSVIDVDRMDFVLRDGHNSGSQFGIYDVLRLVGSFRVHVDEAGGHEHAILIRPLHKALGAIESLIQERYKIYRWVLFHHRVMQSRALMRYVIGEAKPAEFDPRQFQARNYAPPLRPRTGKPETHGYVLLGDGVVDRYLDGRLRELESAGRLSPGETRVRNALRALILRDGYGLSLWKRADDYASDRDPSSFESQLRAQFTVGSPSPPRTRLLQAHGSYANWVASILGRETNRGLLERVVEDMNAEGRADEWYLLEAPSFKKTGDDLVLVPHGSPAKLKPEYLSDLSNIARAIDAAWRDDVHLFAFRFTDDRAGGADQECLKREGRARLARTLAELYRTDPAVQAEFEQIAP